jgi:hypothetical protein
MLQTYIKNRGTMKTIIHKNHRNKVREIGWDANYNGDKANINIDLNNGKHEKHYTLQLDKDNLADLLNVPSVNMPLEKRLLRDFKKSRKSYHNHQPIKPIFIEFDIPTPSTSETLDRLEFEPIMSPNETQTQEIIIPIQRKRITRKYRKHRRPRRSYKRYYKRISYTPYSYSRRYKSRKYRKHRKNKTHRKYTYTSL